MQLTLEKLSKSIWAARPRPPPPRYWGCAQKNECYYAEVFPNCESSKLITFSWDQPCCPLRCLTFPQDFRLFVGEQASLSQILKLKVSDENWLKKNGFDNLKLLYFCLSYQKLLCHQLRKQGWHSRGSPPPPTPRTWSQLPRRCPPHPHCSPKN